MTKRIFLYLLLIFQLFAFASNAEHINGIARPKSKLLYFVPRPAPSGNQLEFSRIKKLVQKNRAIIRIDKSKWKEDLTRLLQHRYSSYTFQVLSAYFPSDVSSSMSLIAISTFIVNVLPHPDRVVHLPGYYSFLHRLCPF
jgi:hypothetical protein